MARVFDGEKTEKAAHTSSTHGESTGGGHGGVNTPERPPTPWHRRPWVWAVGGLAAAGSVIFALGGGKQSKVSAERTGKSTPSSLGSESTTPTAPEVVLPEIPSYSLTENISQPEDPLLDVARSYYYHLEAALNTNSLEHLDLAFCSVNSPVGEGYQVAMGNLARDRQVWPKAHTRYTVESMRPGSEAFVNGEYIGIFNVVKHFYNGLSPDGEVVGNSEWSITFEPCTDKNGVTSMQGIYQQELPL